jgi:hypothetical protein
MSGCRPSLAIWTSFAEDSEHIETKVQETNVQLTEFRAPLTITETKEGK